MTGRTLSSQALQSGILMPRPSRHLFMRALLGKRFRYLAFGLLSAASVFIPPLHLSLRYRQKARRWRLMRTMGAVIPEGTRRPIGLTLGAIHLP